MEPIYTNRSINACFWLIVASLLVFSGLLALAGYVIIDALRGVPT